MTIGKIFLSLLNEKIDEKEIVNESLWIATGLEILNKGVKEHYLSEYPEFNVLQKKILEGDKLYALGLKYIFKNRNINAVNDVAMSLIKISECFTNGEPDTVENIYKAASLWGSAVSLSNMILQEKTKSNFLHYDKLYEAALVLGSIQYFSNSQNKRTRLIIKDIKNRSTTIVDDIPDSLFKDNLKKLLMVIE